VIYVNGKIYTMDKNNSIVEAIAVKDGKILATGKTAELTEKYSGAKTIDLKGKTAIPGFIDAEGNLMEFSKQLSLVDLRFAKSVNEIVKLLKEKVKTAKPEEWVGGFGWDEMKLTEKDLERLDRTILDSISVSHYLYLVNALGNTTWVNSKVLSASKVTKDTPDPAKGSIGVRTNGEPNGLFYDDAQEFIIKIMPPPTESQVTQNVELGISELHKYGITSISDANMSEEVLNVYKKMVDNKKLRLRLYAILNGKSTLFDKYLQSGPEDYNDKIKIKCAGLEFDGYFETQDAAMNHDYFNDPRRKTPYSDEYDIREFTKKAFEKDFQVSVKAIGDRAVTQTLNAIDSAGKLAKNKPGRTRLEYMEFVTPGDMQKIKQLDIIPSIRPEVTLVDKILINDLINPENGKNLGLWNNLYKLNNIIIAGTDFPYHTINPLIQIYYLSTGLGIDTSYNKQFNNTAQKLSLSDAVKSFTVWAAYATFSEDVKGSIEPDKYADFIVLSNDIFTADPKTLLNTKIILTIFDGEIVYENKQAGAYLY
jgi:predicted amidohydrolase YtcJ